MTRLTVLSGSLMMTFPQRRFLAEIDLSAFDRLPVHSTLAESWSLKTVRFSRELVAVPGCFLRGCRRLVDVNSSEWQSLKTIGDLAFDRCWKLKELVIPQSCRGIDVCSSGISALDLQWSGATEVKADGCIHMRRLCLPNRIRCVLVAGPGPAEVHISLRIWPRNDLRELGPSMKPKEMRLFSMRAAPARDGTDFCLLNAQIFADTGSSLVDANLARRSLASENDRSEGLGPDARWGI
jgi:hypothetical protein